MNNNIFPPFPSSSHHSFLSYIHRKMSPPTVPLSRTTRFSPMMVRDVTKGHWKTTNSRIRAGLIKPGQGNDQPMSQEV